MDQLFYVMTFNVEGDSTWIATCGADDAQALIEQQELQVEEGIVAIPLPAWAFKFNAG